MNSFGFLTTTINYYYSRWLGFYNFGQPILVVKVKFLTLFLSPFFIYIYIFFYLNELFWTCLILFAYILIKSRNRTIKHIKPDPLTFVLSRSFFPAASDLTLSSPAVSSPSAGFADLPPLSSFLPFASLSVFLSPLSFPSVLVLPALEARSDFTTLAPDDDDDFWESLLLLLLLLFLFLSLERKLFPNRLQRKIFQVYCNL